MKNSMYCCILLLLCITSLYAGIVETIHFDEMPVITRVKGYDMITFPGADLTAIPGNPQLPIITKHYLIPSNAVVTDLEIISQRSERIEGTFDIFPVQKPSILNTPFHDFEPAPWVNSNPAIYSSLKPYPEQCIEIGATGNFFGYRIVSINIYPFQYIPAEKKINRISEITFSINYKPGMKETTAKKISTPARNALNKALQSICEKQTVDYEPSYAVDGDSTIDYVIITSSAFASYFQPLCDWKTQKGVRAHIVTTDSIYSNCPGVDNQERIRNFIIDANANWGTIWILLGGDDNIIPSRIAYAMTCEAYYQIDEDSLRADLYYADLDGDWNFNGTGPFGEIADSVDLYPDLFIGRAPVSSPTQVSTFVNKILTYEKNPPLDYELNILFFAMVLWDDPYTNGAMSKELIDSLYISDKFIFTKLYEDPYNNLNWNTCMAAINAGQNLLNHSGHAWYTVMSIGDDYLWISDMDNLVNGDRQGILYSIGCWAAAFDYNSIAEHFVNNPNGGGVAFIGNSRYGWGSPGNPRFGYSDRFDATFYNMLLCKGLNNLGSALSMDKAFYISRSRQENVYRWHQYQLNLLGDPEMPVWTDIPRQLSVSYPGTLQNGMDLTVVVRDGNDLPVEDALVCLMNTADMYERGYTNVLGEFKTTITISTAGMITVTVTAGNFLPHIDSVYAKLLGPYLAYLTHTIQDDISGNNDGLLNPGESAYMLLEMENFGTQNVTNPTVLLSTDDAFVTLLDSVHVYSGTVTPQSSIQCTMSISIASNCENGDVAKLNVLATSIEGTWNSFTNQIIAKPVLFIRSDSLNDENNNGILEPGESVDLYYSLMNTGYGYGYDVNCVFTIPDPYLSITGGGNQFWTSIPPENSASGMLSFSISASCPDPHMSLINHSISTTESYVFPGSLIVAIGHFGFSDDMESGTSQWTHAGQTDNWHLSSYRKHSGNYSWYCGIESSHTYESNSNDSLWSIPFHIGPNTRLTFWQWYEFTNYGTDGLYVIIKRQSQSDTLDFIGSGGALDSTLTIWNDWFREEYNLSYIPAGEQVQLCFSFISDNDDIAEGIYVDDVNIEGDHITGKKEIEFIEPVSYNLSVYPSPMQHTTNILLGIEQSAQVKVTVYDICGRKVKRLVNGTLQQGQHLITWSGTSDGGRQLPHGIYFIRMEIPESGFTFCEKIMLIR